MGVHFIKIYGESSQMRALFWASVDNSYSFPHSMHIFLRVINILIVENRCGVMLQFYYIKTRHRFVSNHSKCLSSVCFRNASEFQDTSVREFQFGETTEERR